MKHESVASIAKFLMATFGIKVAKTLFEKLDKKLFGH